VVGDVNHYHSRDYMFRYVFVYNVYGVDLKLDELLEIYSHLATSVHQRKKAPTKLNSMYTIKTLYTKKNQFVTC